MGTIQITLAPHFPPPPAGGGKLLERSESNLGEGVLTASPLPQFSRAARVRIAPSRKGRGMNSCDAPCRDEWSIHA